MTNQPKTPEKRVNTYYLGTYNEEDFPSLEAMCEKIQEDAKKVLQTPEIPKQEWEETLRINCIRFANGVLNATRLLGMGEKTPNSDQVEKTVSDWGKLLISDFDKVLSQALEQQREEIEKEIERDFSVMIDPYEYRGAISPQLAKEQTMFMVRKIISHVLAQLRVKEKEEHGS